MMDIFLFTLLISYLYCLQEVEQISQCGNGRATYYQAESEGNCGFGNIAGKIDTAAATEEIYDGSNGCGICYEVIGEKGSRIVMIADRCPGCEPVKNNGVIHLDLDERIFPYIDDKDKGRINTSMRMVPCQVTGNVILHISGSNNYFNAYASNYKIGLKTLQININNQGFKDVKREMWNRFVQAGISGLNSIQVKLISISGQELICYNDKNIIEGDYDCGSQFSADKFFDIYSRKIIGEKKKSECCVKPSLITDISKCNIQTDDIPDSDTPDSDTPDSDAPDSDAPHTDAPHSDAPTSSSNLIGFSLGNYFKYCLLFIIIKLL